MDEYILSLLVLLKIVDWLLKKKCTGCPQKNFILLWKAISPLKIVVGIKVGGVSESAGADLSLEYQNFPVALQGAEKFEFKVSPVLNSRHHIQKS